ncbi:TLR2 [Branchiostoma lanceolatum]|uniref:TLR2 protein n=1 Tax=Branchiostoma lanceolatum TaxID=7740 RepID=A0A8J9VDY7_BRALA|nr:TLR2 [Branchiostoma lanceolatum]
MSDTGGQEGNTALDFDAGPDNTQPHAAMSGQSRGSEELDFHSPAESEDDTDSKSSSNDERPQVGVAPPLGQQEKYHVFFSYSKADAPWVKYMVQKLESDELGFKCCFHERDFPAGRAIIDNIVRSIERSRKTVFVLSREFVTSNWCTYEMQMVMRRHLSEGEKIVIPVMLRECVVPEFIQHMTYLEEWTPYFFDKFIGALKEPASDDPGSQSDSFSTFTYNPNYNNGQQLWKIEATTACCPPCAQFDDQIIPSELTSKGIRIPREDYNQAISKLMDTGKMNGFSCCSSEVGRTMKRTLLEVNSILAKSHILATVTDRCICYPVAILHNQLHFVYYERGSCLMTILEDLMARSTSGSPAVTSSSSSNMNDPPELEGASSCAVPIDVDDAAPLLSEGGGDRDIHEDTSSQTSRMSELKTEAEALLLKYSDQYVRLLVSRKLPQPRQSRGHTQQGACLCQLVELREFGWKLDREEPSVRASGDPSVV